MQFSVASLIIISRFIHIAVVKKFKRPPKMVKPVTRGIGYITLIIGHTPMDPFGNNSSLSEKGKINHYHYDNPQHKVLLQDFRNVHPFE